MKRLILVAAFACKSSSSSSEKPPPPPPPPVARPQPEQLVALSCTACHGADLLAQQRLTAKQWEAGLKKMVSWGALVENRDQPALVAYLAASYHGDYAAPEITADALAAIEPTPDGAFAGGDVARGKAAYDQSCAACHAADGRGNAVGTNLVDRYLLYRAGDFAAIVRAGRGRMLGATLRDAELADVLAWLRTLRAAS